MRLTLALAAGLTGCQELKKDNEPKSPDELSVEVSEQLAVYRPLIRGQADSYGLMVMDGSIGDSALFSCLAYAAGAAEFDPAVLFTEEGRPLRHPDIYDNAPSPGEPDYEEGKFTTISKDMVNGILTCLHTLGKKDKAKARALVEKMIAYGRSHKEKDLWKFCTDEDRAKYNISDERWYGRCIMTPAVPKDTYRVAISLGWHCDTDCQITMNTGTNIPSNGEGFERHLAVLTTMRNGFVEGAINDNSLRIVLENAAKAQPRNGLYLAAYHTFGDGDQLAAYMALRDEALFPRDALPTAANYCTSYLFQRDDDSQSGKEEPDWLPCKSDHPAGPRGRGIEWVYAACVALGECR